MSDLSNQAEQSVLGALLMSPQAIPEILSTLKPEDFWNQRHRMIYEAIVALSAEHEAVDSMMVATELKRRGQDEQTGGMPYLFTLAELAPLPETISHHVEMVKEEASRKRILEAGQRIQSLAKENIPLDDVLSQAQAAIDAANQADAGDVEQVASGIDGILERVDAARRGEPAPHGVWTGFRELDEITNGFMGGQMIIVGARPGVGKSTLATDFMREASLNHGYPTLLYSLEMSRKEVQQRMLAADSTVKFEDIKSGRVSDQDRRKLQESADRLRAAPIFIDDSPDLTMLDISAKTQMMVKRHGIKMVVVDYIQLLKSGAWAESRQQEVANFSRQLKLLAKKCDIPIVAVAQVNRQVTQRGEDTAPKPSDLRESGALEQDADIILMLHRPDTQNAEHGRAGEADIHVAKHRGGRVGIVSVAHQMHYSRFVDFRGDMR